MPTYITLASWTDQGIRNIKESPARLDATKEMFRSKGAEMKQFYLVTGQYDLVVISEAPDDATIAKVALASGSQGAVRTVTLRAFTEDEYRKIVGDMP
jgi:uncharacterized protein with GYD domain